MIVNYIQELNNKLDEQVDAQCPSDKQTSNIELSSALMLFMNWMLNAQLFECAIICMNCRLNG